MSGEESEYGGGEKVDENSGKKEDELGPDYHKDPTTGELVYVDPVSKVEYVLNEDKSGWIPKKTDYEFDGNTYTHTDDKGVKHKWDLESKTWVKMAEKEEEEEEESEEDDNTTDEDRKRRQFRKRKAQPGWGQTGEYLKDPDTGAQLYRDKNDGMLYEWDQDKNAWFPRIDEDFMAQYQMSYGFDNDLKAKPTVPDQPEPTEEKVQFKLYFEVLLLYFSVFYAFCKYLNCKIIRENATNIDYF